MDEKNPLKFDDYLKIALVQIYRFAPEEWLLRKMAGVFLRSGYRMVLWTNREFGTAGLPAVPLSRGGEDDAIFNLKLCRAGDWPELCVWEAFEKQFKDRYGRTEPAYDSLRCHRISSSLFDHLRPSLFLCWSGMDPWYAIPKAIAKERGIPVLTWEAGMLPQTLLLDRDGICAESQWVSTPIPSISDRALVKAEAYISHWKESLLGGVNSEGRNPEFNRNKRILILGGLDSANGVMRAPKAGKETLPGFTDGIDLAIQTAELHPGETIYRPHPNEPPLPLMRLHGTRVALDRSSNIVDAILKTDIVIGYGSKTDFLAMALGMPFIMAGIGLVTGKNCAYESTAPEQLAHAIAEASKRGRTEQQQEIFRALVAWMLEEIHYNRIRSGPCEKGIVGFVQDALLHAKEVEEGGDFEATLSEKGRCWWEDAQTQYRFLRKCAIGRNALPELESKISQLPGEYRAVLDFDHTLFLGNSTERFLLTVYPRLWGETIDKTARCFWNLCGKRRGSEIDRWRVLAAVIFAPWSLLWWKFTARREAEIHWNEALEKVATVGRSTRTVIISLGFSQLIEPLVKARHKKQAPINQPHLICSDLFSPSTSLRKLGKARALEAAIPEINWPECFAVSDSEEDRDLLLRCRKGFHLQWDEPPTNPRPGYFPFRFLERGKFRGRGYVKHFILEQDFVVWIFAYGLTPNQALPAWLFCLSLHSIYEIGYYENDYLAAKTEKSPTLFFNLDDFKHYPMALGGWAFSLLTGTLGVFILHGEWNALAVGKWLLLLVLLRISFYIYNRQITENRLLFYAILQTIKNFGGVVVMALNPVGLALAVGHAFQHTSVYQIYRCGGDKEKFPRSLMRAVVFLLGVAVICLVEAPVHPGWFILALAWCVYQVFLEKRGFRYSIINLAIHFLFRLPLRIFRKARREFQSVQT